MDGLSTKSKLHTRVSNFVGWIAPDSETREEIKKQADEIRERISNKAKEDGLQVTSTPRAGSFAKKTGLRRHMRGNSEVEGQDIDVPFVVKPAAENGFALQPMVNKFLKYANDSYPQTEKESTKSSVRLKFTSTLSYDLVPLFATDDSDKQILVRSTGERILTSVQKHTDFVRKRTEKSDQKKGVVAFNECVRLMKWWRDVRCADASYLKEVPSIIVDLLCAKAFDRFSVQTTYAHTLTEWCAYLAHVVVKREPVWFTDYTQNVAADSASNWSVIDPVNSDNNLARRFQSYEVDELADWLQNARDTWNRAIAAEMMGDDNRSLEQLMILFGNPFKNHCEG
jgi:Second Messenger Oligonucleotide or Dinucleotide Synthetase domain